jgi:hypothetical protein
MIIVVGAMVFLTGTRSQTQTADAAKTTGRKNSCLTAGQFRMPDADPQAKATLLPEHSYVTPSEICTIQVWVDGSEDSLACIECWVSFDTSLVDLILAEEGRLFETAPFQRLFFWQEITPDTQSVEGCLLHYTAYTLLPGEIARFVFEAKSPGVCPVKITRLNLFDKARVMYEPIIDPNAWIIIGNSTGAEPPPVEKGEFRAFPNPFNPSTTLVLRVSGNVWNGAGTHATITIYSPAGEEIRSLFDGSMTAGESRVIWDGRDGGGAKVASGVYFAVARTGSKTYTTKLVLVQ